MTETAHVPSGNYPAPAPIHLIDLDEAADRLWAKLPGHRRQSENLGRQAGTSVVMMAMEAGDSIEEHSAPGVVSVQILRGHATLSTAEEAFEVRPGQLVLMEPGFRHDLRAEEQTVVLLVIAGSQG